MRCFIFWVICIGLVNAQNSIPIQSSDSIALTADCFWGVDAFNNLYYSTQNTLYKTGNKKQFKYKNVLFADISGVDITNPLNIIAFYKNNNSAVLLDNNLNEIRIINFNNNTDFKNVTFATTSANQQLWIFNNQSQQLELYNYGTLVSKKMGQPINEPVIDMKSNYNFCWLLTPLFIYRYNTYGSLLDKIPFENGEQLQVGKNDTLLIKKNNRLYLLTNGSITELDDSVEKFLKKDFFLAGDYLYIYDGKNFLRKHPFLKK